MLSRSPPAPHPYFCLFVSVSLSIPITVYHIHINLFTIMILGHPTNAFALDALHVPLQLEQFILRYLHGCLFNSNA